MKTPIYWGPPGPWRDRFELLAVECRIAVLRRDAGPYLDDLYEFEDRAGDPLDRPRLRDEDAVFEYHRRKRRHEEQWKRRVSELQDELDLARQCHQSEHLPEGTTFYVDAVRDSAVVLLAGPFSSHEEALRLVPRAREVTERFDRRAFLYRYGTCSLPPGPPPEMPYPEIHREIVSPPPPPPPPAKRGRKASVAAYTHKPR